MTSQQASNVLCFAKEGNPKAISALINRQLKSKNITTKSTVRDSRLDILLEAEKIPEQQVLVEFIGKGLTSLSPHGISSVKLFARKTGEDFFDWEATFNIPFESSTNYLDSSVYSDSPQALDKSHNKSDKRTYGVLGKNGQIKLTRKRVIIYRKGFWGFMAQGASGGKEIPINRITAVQFKEAGGITAGFLQLSISGSIESTGGVFNAANDENTVLFEPQQQKDFEEIKRYVDSVMDEEPIDFQTLSLLDFEAVEKERIEKQEKTTANVKRIHDEQMSFSTQLEALLN